MTYDIYSEKVYTQILKLKSDEGKLRCIKNYSVVNGNIADHLAEAAANIKCRILPKVMQTRRDWDVVFEVEYLKEIYPVFKDVFKYYMVTYLEETDLLPACADDYQMLLDDMEMVLAREEERERIQELA